MRQTLFLVALAAACLLMAGCAQDGDPAPWTLDAGGMHDSSTKFTALVSRVECSGGWTGEVLPPDINKNNDEIVVTFEVEAYESSFAECPGNPDVAYVVDLGEPLGNRALVDGYCRTKEGKGSRACTTEVRSPAALLGTRATAASKPRAGKAAGAVLLLLVGVGGWLGRPKRRTKGNRTPSTMNERASVSDSRPNGEKPPPELGA